MPNKRVFTSRNVVLSDGRPRPATLIVDVDTGKITDILDRTSARTDFPDVGDADWFDAGDRHLLPGIVECVPGAPVPFPHLRSEPGARTHALTHARIAARTST